MTDFLLELRSEEIPARMQARAREDLRWAFETEIRQEGALHQGRVTTYSTPRRLVLIAHELADATEAETEEFKGPRVGAPDAAVEGFLRKVGVPRSELYDRADAKGVATYYVQRQKLARSTVDVLATIIPRIIRAFPWPKSMRWGAESISTESLRWVRPLHGIVALFGEELVPVEIAGPTGSRSEADNKVVSGYATLGHRFHHPGPITLGGAHDYVEKLRACHVIVDQAEREALIRERAARLAAEAGLELIADEGLVVENAGLTEWPVPLLGRFDPAFLAVPPEVIQLTARVNQKYFVCRDAGGALANAFVCTANIDAVDGGAAIVEGNRKVLAARLSDARFFYEQDLRVPLEEQAAKLDRIVFHEKLGKVADKVERVAKLARWLVEEGIVGSSPYTGRGTVGEADGGGAAAASAPSGATAPPPPATRSVPLPVNGEDREKLATLAERAARLCKADLVTGMVGEFPELQGVMGGYYAREAGEDPQVADAIRDHYKPVGQGDEVPTAPVTVAVSLADKLDTLIAFFVIKDVPSGSRDPFALRRAAISVARLILTNDLRMSLRRFVGAAELDVLVDVYASRGSPVQKHRARSLLRAWTNVDRPPAEVLTGLNPDVIARRTEFGTVGRQHLMNFFADRLKVQQREAGVRHDLIDAVFALGGEDDLVRLLARVRALQGFVGTEDGANLLAGYKRAANILKKEGWGTSPSPHGGEGRGEGGQGYALPSASATTEVSPQSSPPSPPLPGPLPKGEREKDSALPYVPAPAEAALIAALDAAEPAADAAIAREDFEAAMLALASLRAPIDAFFETVTVNDPDPATRAARLDLLARVRAAVHRVADFSRIEG